MKKKGFTLVELVIVLALLAIFSSLLIPALSTFFDNTNTQIVEIYNNINERDSEIRVEEEESGKVIYEGKMSEWEEKEEYKLIRFERKEGIVILYVTSDNIYDQILKEEK